MYVSVPMSQHAAPPMEIRDPDYPLLERIAGGDRQALDELVHRHADAMWKVALRFCNGNTADAEDVVQEACLACLGSAHTYGKRGSVRSWVLAITANAARAYQRKAHRRRHHETQVHVPNPPPLSEPDDGALREAARTSLAELREPFRTILSLRYLDELDDSAIAATLGLSEVTVRTRCHRAVGYLRSALSRRGFAVGATALVAVLAPTHAAAMPPAVSLLMSSACATGLPTTVTLAASSFAGAPPTLWFGAKIAASLVAIGAIAVGTATFMLSEPPPEPRAEVFSAPPPIAPPPATVADAILDQTVTLHLNDVELDTALTLLRISLPLNHRPRFILGFPTRFRGTKDLHGGAYLPAADYINPDPDALLIPVTLAVEGQSLRNALDTLCQANGLRWWKEESTIFIDKPLTPAELSGLVDAFQQHGDVANARALAKSTDSNALRSLLVALADKNHGPIAAQALGEWIKQRTTALKMSASVQGVESFKITDAYDRNILARFAKDPEVIKAATDARNDTLLPLTESIYLCGQLGVPDIVTQCLELAKQIPPPNALSATLGWGTSKLELNQVAVSALGWNRNAAAIAPLIAIVESERTDNRLRILSARALCNFTTAAVEDRIIKLLKNEEHPFEIDGKLYSLVAEFSNPFIIPTLQHVISENPIAQSYAILALSFRGDQEAFKVLHEIATMNDFPNSQFAVDGLLLHEHPMVDEFLAFSFKNNAVGNIDYTALRRHVTKRSRPFHFELFSSVLLDDKIPDVEYSEVYDKAASTLIIHDKDKAERFLFETFPNKEHPAFPAYCSALAGLSKRGSDLILKLSADPDPAIRIIACKGLVSMGDIGRQRLFHLIENDLDEEVCAAAFEHYNPNPRASYNTSLARPPIAQWKQWLAHRFPAVRIMATSYISYYDECFSATEWPGLMDVIIASPELRHKTPILCDFFHQFYNKDARRWRAAIPLILASPDRDRRIDLWDQFEHLLDEGYLRLSLKGLLAPEDKLFLLEAAAKAASTDDDPKVRARAGWTLAASLRQLDVQELPAYERLEASLISCAQNEADPLAKKVLQQAVNLKPFTSEHDKHKDRAEFTWPDPAP